MSLMQHLHFEDDDAKGNSALHRLDARIKLICAIVAIFSIVVLSRWYTPLLFFGICLGLAIYARAPLRTYLDRLLIPITLVAFIGIIMPFTYGTTIIARVPFLTIPIYSQGIYFGVLVFTRAISAVSVLNLLILVTPISSVMDSFAWFHMPGVIVDTMMLMFRYIGILSDESERMYRAQASRGGHSKRVSFFKKMLNYGNIGGSLIVRAFDRSVAVGNAMISRGYTGKQNLFKIEKKKLPVRDSIIGVLTIAVIILTVLVDAFLLPHVVHIWIFY